MLLGDARANSNISVSKLLWMEGCGLHLTVSKKKNCTSSNIFCII